MAKRRVIRSLAVGLWVAVFALAAIFFGPPLRPHRLTVAADLASATIDLPSGTFSVDLPDSSKVGKASVAVPEGTATVEIYPRSHYAAVGLQDPGYVLLALDFTLPGEPVRDLSYYMSSPPPDAVITGYSTIRDLMSHLDTVDDGALGQACDLASGGPAILAALEAHTCFTDCVGLSIVTRDALAGAGRDARVITLTARSSTLPNGMIVEDSESHTAVEVRRNGQWTYVGPALGIRRVEDATGRPLDVYELIKGLASSRDTLGFVVGSTTVHFAELPAPIQAALLRDFTVDKTLSAPTAR